MPSFTEAHWWVEAKLGKRQFLKILIKANGMERIYLNGHSLLPLIYHFLLYLSAKAEDIEAMKLSSEN